MPGQSLPGQSLPGQRIGSAIAAVFGLIYVVVNTGPFPAAWTVALRILAALAFIAVLVAVLRSSHPSSRSEGRQQRVFTRAYWWVVIAEVIALFVGARLLSGPFHLPQAGVAWVSVVVGVHFFALAVVFGEPFFHWLGGAITACGIAGLVLAVTGDGALPIDLVAGVVPGILLLAFGWWGANRSPAAASDLIEPGPHVLGDRSARPGDARVDLSGRAHPTDH